MCLGCNDKYAGQVTITGHTCPTSVSAAVSASRWYQLKHQVIFRSRSRGYGGDFLRRANNESGGRICLSWPLQTRRVLVAKLSDQKDVPDEPMNDRVSKLEKQMGRVLGMLDGIQGSLGKIASTNKPRYDRSPSPTRRQVPKLACFACGEEGHFAANCPKIRHKSVSWVSGGDGEVSCPLSGLNDSGSDPEA